MRVGNASGRNRNLVQQANMDVVEREGAGSRVGYSAQLDIIRKHLMDMVVLLRDEDAKAHLHIGGGHQGERVARMAGQCLECFLEERILDKFVALALSDVRGGRCSPLAAACPDARGARPQRPPGTKSLVLRAIERLLREVTHPLLPHMTVHEPLSHLINTCVKMELEDPDQHAPSAARESLVALVQAICMKLQDDATMVTFFYEPARPAAQGRQPSPPKLGLATALLRPLHDPDTTGAHAREALVALLSLQDSHVYDFLCEHTGFADSLAEALAAAFDALCAASAASATSSDAHADTRSQARHVFTQRLQFCLSVMQALSLFHSAAADGGQEAEALHARALTPSPPLGLADGDADAMLARRLAGRAANTKLGAVGAATLARRILDAVRRTLLDGAVLGELLQTNEDQAAAAMCHLRDMVEVVGLARRPNLLLAELIHWMLGDGRLPEREDAAAVGGVDTLALPSTPSPVDSAAGRSPGRRRRALLELDEG